MKTIVPEARHCGALQGDGRWQQIEMADVLGVSVVHLNKTLQALKRECAFTWENRTITIVDWERLQEVAEFDPSYLSISREPR